MPLHNLTPENYQLMAEKPEISKSVWNQSGHTYSSSFIENMISLPAF